MYVHEKSSYVVPNMYMYLRVHFSAFRKHFYHTFLLFRITSVKEIVSTANQAADRSKNSSLPDCLRTMCTMHIHWREGRREEGKEGGKEGGREGRRAGEGGREGRRASLREGGRESVCFFPVFYCCFL